MQLARGVSILVLCSVGASCTLLNSLDGYQSPVRLDAGAQPDTALQPDVSVVDSGADSGPVCASRMIPVQPDIPDTGTKTLFVAMRRFDLPAKNAKGEEDGLNLDGLCTCPGKPACTPPNRSIERNCDGPGGADNGVIEFIRGIARVLPVSDFADPNVNLNAGVDNLFIHISGWNGLPDDPRVSVGLIASSRLEASTKPTLLPAFDGQDRWAILSDTVKAGVTPYEPAIVDSNAYVAGGFLVVRINYFLRFGTTGLPVEYGRMVAKIVADGATFRLTEGRLAGRVTASAFLSGLQNTNDAIQGGFLCKGKQLFEIARTEFCKRLDLMATPVEDGVADATCQSISLNAGFETTPALMGSLVPPRVPGNNCGPNYSVGCGP